MGCMHVILHIFHLALHLKLQSMDIIIFTFKICWKCYPYLSIPGPPPIRNSPKPPKTSIWTKILTSLIYFSTQIIKTFIKIHFYLSRLQTNPCDLDIAVNVLFKGYITLIPIPIGSHYKTDNFHSIFLAFPTYQFFRTWYHFKDGSVIFQ